MRGIDITGAGFPQDHGHGGKCKRGPSARHRTITLTGKAEHGENSKNVKTKFERFRARLISPGKTPNVKVVHSEGKVAVVNERYGGYLARFQPKLRYGKMIRKTIPVGFNARCDHRDKGYADTD